jgi:creatinine amidohydrolase
MIRELTPQVGIFICAINWFRIVDQKPYFSKPDDHGGEMETSVMMHFVPELVLPLSEAGDGRERKPKIAAMREGWAWAPRPWTKISADTGVGDPRAASASKGAAYFAAVTDKIAQFLVDLAKSDTHDLYEKGGAG